MNADQAKEHQGVLGSARLRGRVWVLQANPEALVRITPGQAPGDFSQRALNGAQLQQDHLAVAAGLDHPGDRMQMALGAAQAAEQVGLELTQPRLHWRAIRA